MKNFRLLLFILVLIAFAFSVNLAVSGGKLTERQKRAKINRKIDNINYWVQMAEKGYVPFNAYGKAEPATFTGSKIKAFSVVTEDSPDVPVTTENSTQSENSVFVDPNNEKIVLNSNNSTPNPATGVYGANDFFTFDGGETWDGEVQGAGEGNSGDPTTAISLNGRWFVNYIDGGSNYGGMGISYSDDQGNSWTPINIVGNPGQLADKNHMWIDNSPTSPYEGNIYVAWTDFGGSYNQHVMISISTDNGETWSAKKEISSGASTAFSHGVNLTTGPNGEVYAVWAIYDGSGLTEHAIGFAKSLDGGQTWSATKAIDNIHGIRDYGVSKNMRVNSFPVIDCDISDGENSGNLYITWSNRGVPGINSGNDIDVYVITSDNQGASWNTPVKVNQDEAGLGHEHFSPWIACDPNNGIVSVIFYDDRNVGGNKLETYCANSDDEGQTWEDFKVSDVSFTPSPIPGLANSYFGDYIGISANNGVVYPTWTDNRTGTAMTYVSPYENNPLNKPYNLVASVTFETGSCYLSWQYNTDSSFQYFNIYRDGNFLSTTTDTTFNDMLPDYNYYQYKVTAFYGADLGESSATKVNTQWGDAHIAISIDSVYQKILIDSTENQSLCIHNTGQLPLNLNIYPVYTQENGNNDYCEASGGGVEYISRVRLGDYVNESGEDGYADYTNLDWRMNLNDALQLYVTNGNGYSDDQCGVWIDWDGNGIFDDEPVTIYNTPGSGPYMAVVTPPANTKIGNIRMRIRIMWSGNLDPCGTTAYGEVEDYSINIAWLDNTPSIDTIAPGDSSLINLTFMAAGATLGSYIADLNIASNDPDLAQSNIPVTMDVYQFYADINASANGICSYETDSVILSINAEGTIDSLSYQWHSSEGDMDDVTSTVKVLPSASTWYYATTTDLLGNLYSDSVFVEVYTTPIVNLGADSTVCWAGGEALVLDAGNPGASYLWSTGDTLQTVTLQETPGSGIKTYWAEVTNKHGCINSDTIKINFAQIPMVDLGNDTSLCAQDGSGILLEANNLGASYNWSTGDTLQTLLVDTANMGYGMHNISIVVTNVDGCTSTDDIIVELKDCTGINAPEDITNVSVYPNPGSGRFNVEINATSFQKVDLLVLDNRGKIVYQKTNLSFEGQKTITINLSEKTSGVYQLLIKGKTGLINKKLIIL